MIYVACGLNHKTASLKMREKLARPLELQKDLLTQMVDTTVAHEVAMLSTCNRTEIYCYIDKPAVLLPWLAEQYQLPWNELSPCLYMHQNHHAIRHTLRVASGLDSMMLGEPQILGQMKQAYQHACQLGTVKKRLRSTFQYIFSASKRIRNQSGIGHNPVSIAYAGAQLIGQVFDRFHSLGVMLIGSGETSALVAKYLQKHGVKNFLIANRTLENAEQLAASLNGRAISISDIPDYLPQADVVISATACPVPIINQSLVSYALEKRQFSPMFLLDLSVPRDIDEDVREIPLVQLYNVDDLHIMIENGLSERRHSAIQAEQLISSELNNYIRWHRTLRAKESICQYRTQMQELAQQELQRASQKLLADHCPHEVLTEFSERLVKKLTHNPTTGLRRAAQDGRQELLRLAHYLFKAYNESNGT